MIFALMIFIATSGNVQFNGFSMASQSHMDGIILSKTLGKK
jgi:hypothetical protein